MTRIEAIEIATKMHAALESLQSKLVSGNFFTPDPFFHPLLFGLEWSMHMNYMNLVRTEVSKPGEVQRKDEVAMQCEAG